jgi:hypothetical protein
MVVLVPAAVGFMGGDDSVQELHALAWEEGLAHGLDHGVGRLDDLGLGGGKSWTKGKKDERFVGVIGRGKDDERGKEDGHIYFSSPFHPSWSPSLSLTFCDRLSFTKSRRRRRKTWSRRT